MFNKLDSALTYPTHRTAGLIYMAPQFGTLLTPADLRTLPGAALNLATWTYNKLVPAWDDWTPSPLNQLRQQHGLPWSSSSCPLTEGLRWLLGCKTLKCEALVEVVMGTWLVEWPRTLPANTIMVGPGKGSTALQP